MVRKQRTPQADPIMHINPEDVKQTVEVAFKTIPREQIETIEKPGDINGKVSQENRRLSGEASKLKTGKKTKTGRTRKTRLRKGEEIEEIIEKPLRKKSGNYTLIITEKPQAAEKIAKALGDARKYVDGGVAYFELKRDNKKLIVACAVGHLFNLTQEKGEKGWPIFNLKWEAEFKRNAWARKYYTLLKKLARDASDFIVASVDYNEITPILEKNEFKILKIGEVVDSIIEGEKRKDDFKVPAFDSNGKIEFRDLKKAIRHPINESLYELSLEYGRKVRLTASHNVFTLNDNIIENVKTTNLKIGDKILCPAFLPCPQDYKKEINFLELINHDKKRDLYVSGEDVAKMLKRKVINLKRKNTPLNDKRVILTINGRDKIKISRTNQGNSTSVIGKRAEVCQSSIVQWENGIRNPSLANFSKYLIALNLNPKEFIENREYCTITESSFSNLLSNIYKTQFKNFSNLSRATIPLYSLNEENIQDLKEGFIYGSKNKRNKLPIRIPITKELVRLMGYYLAEGDINNDYRIRFSLGLQGYGHEQRIIDEIKEFCSLYDIESHYYLHKKIKHRIITIDNSVLALLFDKIFSFGNGARNKRIPGLIFNLPVDLKKEFLNAYFLGDGSINKSGISFNTSSENLASDISYLLLQLELVSSTYQVKNSSKSNLPSWHVSITNSSDLIKIKEVWQYHHLSSKLKISKKSIKKRNLAYFGDLNAIKIKDIRKVQPSNKYVYDFSVEGENFIAGNGGVCCHNTDYDIEGEVIGLNIIRFIAKQQDAKRMKFSSLTKPELEQAYNEVSPTLNWGQAIAGESRHYLDWLYGINLSRALMEAIKMAGSFRIMSVGRVQGPALNLVIEKERQISAFKSEPFWQVFIIVEGIEFKYPRDITKKVDLEAFQNLNGKTVQVETEKSEQKIKPPTPFDLTTLQTEAYKFFSLNPAKTLQIAQSLYLAGLISYPRTSSQKIPDAISPLEIIKKLGKAFDTSLCINKKPVEGAKSDPAHPSIYPTGEFSSLDGDEKKIYELIVRRFLACFCEEAIIDNKTITAMLEELKFVAKGLSVRKKAWMEVYRTKMQERELPDMNGQYVIEDSRIDEKQTQPPNRYSPASLVRELEKRNLGTKATRASIVETLYDRGYIREQSIHATPLGISLIESLEKHCPIIIDEALTRNFEKEMNSILTATKGLQDKEKKILDDAKDTITKISKKFKEEEKEIGKELLEANKDLREQERKENELTECPVCKKGKLRILYNKNSRRYFIGCSNYPECKTTFSLPPNGLMKSSRDKDNKQKICDECGFPKLLAIRKGKRPWEYCFNPNCVTRNRKEED